MGARSEWQELVGLLRRHGFEVRKTKGGHMRVTDAAGHYRYTLPSSPSCPRAYRNTVAEIRRVLGVEVA